MRAGRLRHRISIQRRDKSYDKLGHDQSDWKSVVCNLPAEVVELSGRELERARQLVEQVTVRITLRRSPAQVKDRIVFRGRMLNVMSVTGDEIGTEQTILCEEVKQG